MKKTLLFFALFGSILSFSQTFFGVVLDQETKEPLANVSLTADGVLIGYTDIDGAFYVELDSSFEWVSLALLGYLETQYNVINQSITHVSIELIVSTEVLKDVVVTSSRYQQNYTESSVSLDVIKPYLLQEQSILTVEETFAQSPGVNMTDGQANIRGGSGWSYGTGSRVLVLLDGLPLYSADANQVQWDLLPYESLAQMEVIKGASSTSYGSSAMNGIVQLSTRNPLDKPQTFIQINQGFYDSPQKEEWKWWSGTQSISQIQFSTQDRGEKSGWLIGGQLLYDEGFQYLEETKRARLHAKYGYDHKNWQWGVEGSYMHDQTGESLIWKSYDNPYLPLDSSATQTNANDWFVGGNVSYRKGRGMHSFKSRFLSVNNDAKSELTNYENYSVLSFFDYQYQHVWENLTWVTGASYQLGSSTSEIFGGTYGTQNMAIFSEAEYTWNRLTATAGIRYEAYQIDERNFDRPVVRAGLNYKAGKETYLRASAGQGFRFPAIGETYPTTNIGAINIYPNPELDAEQGWSGELGVKQGVKMGQWMGYIDFSAFIMKYENMMEFSFAQWNSPTAQDFGIGFKSVNVGPTQITGAELTFMGTGQIGTVDLKFLAGYAYMLPVALEPTKAYAYTFDGSEVTYQTSSSDASNNILKYRYQHLVKIDVSASYKRFTLGVNLQGYGVMQNVDAIFAKPEPPFNRPIIEFFYPEIGIKQSMDELNNPKALVGLRLLYNLTERFQVGLNGKNVSNEALLIRPAKMSSPRSYFLQVTYRL